MLTNNPDSSQPMRVCYFGTYRDDYSRNKVMIEGLRRNGVDVIECHVPIWRGIQDRVNLASGGWLSLAFFWRVLRTYVTLIWKYAHCGSYDVMVIGYPGQFDVYLGWILTRLKRKPLCWDVLMSIYLVALERKLDNQSRITIAALRKIEKAACSLANLMILESQEYIDWFVDTHQSQREKFWMVPLGADDDRIRPIPVPKANQKAGSPVFRVIYWGSFIPNHGVDIMLDAAYLLRNEPGLEFEFIGSGPERDKILNRAQEKGLQNVCFPGWVADEVLLEKVAQADLCFGVFGNTPQSLMTIQNKIHECFAMQKPLVSGRSSVVERTLHHEQQLYLCERTPQSLADAIRHLRSRPDLLAHIAQQGYIFFKENYTIRKIGAQFYAGLLSLLKS